MMMMMMMMVVVKQSSWKCGADIALVLLCLNSQRWWWCPTYHKYPAYQDKYHKCPTYQDKYLKSHIVADLCLIFSTDLAHGDSVKDVEPENAKVSQVLPARVKSTCHWLSLSAAAKVLFIEILDFAKS